MALPRKVQEAADRADRLQREYAGQNTTPEGEAQAQNAPPAQEPQAQAQEPAQQVAAPTPPAQEPAPQPTTQAQPDQWEHRYKVLAGKYSAEVPRLNEQIRELQAQIDQLKAAPSPADPVHSDMTPEQVVDKFGPEFAQAVAAIVAPMADSRMNRVLDKVTPKVDQVERTVNKTAREVFLDNLTSAVSNWKEIDSDPGFTAFLDEVDPMTGYPRRRFFNEADLANDAARVARFFKTYAGTNQAPADPTKRISPDIERQLAPQTSSATTQVPPGKKVWTRGEIAAFYANARRGLVPASDYQRIESDIFAAQQEGRVAA